MKTQKALFQCKQCSGEIEGHLLVDCSVKMFTTALKEIKCPKGCDWKQLQLLTSTLQEAEELQESRHAQR